MNNLNKILMLVGSRVTFLPSSGLWQVRVRRTGGWENAGKYDNKESAVLEALDCSKNSFDAQYFAGVAAAANALLP